MPFMQPNLSSPSITSRESLLYSGIHSINICCVSKWPHHEEKWCLVSRSSASHDYAWSHASIVHSFYHWFSRILNSKLLLLLLLFFETGNYIFCYVIIGFRYLVLLTFLASILAIIPEESSFLISFSKSSSPDLVQLFLYCCLDRCEWNQVVKDAIKWLFTSVIFPTKKTLLLPWTYFLSHFSNSKLFMSSCMDPYGCSRYTGGKTFNLRAIVSANSWSGLVLSAVTEKLKHYTSSNVIAAPTLHHTRPKYLHKEYEKRPPVYFPFPNTLIVRPFHL